MASRREHQKQAVADTLSGFKKHDRGQLVMACGTGKTLVALWVKEDLDAERTLVLVPSIALVDQFASEWRKHHAADREFTALCVCSDTTVGQLDDEDSVRFTTEDLSRDGFDVTSDPERIASFLKRSGRKVVFSTYQSLHQIAKAQMDDSVPAFDLAIADEAHRCAGDQNGLYATILDGDRVRANKRLFATATPKIFRAKKGQDEADQTVVDMSDEDLFGPRFHALSFGEAIRQNLLSDYRVVIVMVDASDAQAVIGNSDDEAKILQAAQVGLLKAIDEYGLRRVVSFHSRIDDASRFAGNLPAVASAMKSVGKLTRWPSADHVSGKMLTDERKKKMEVFRSNAEGTCRVLTNVRCLAEGVDVPDIDGVAFIDPKSSEVEIIQALGRAIRKHEDKPYGVVILPVFAGKGDSATEVIENSNFKPVWDVLNALRAHDTEFDTVLKQWRQAKGSGERPEEDPCSKIRVIGTHHVPEFASSLRPLMIEELTNSFEETFGVLSAYKALVVIAPTRSNYSEQSSPAVGLQRRSSVARRAGRIVSESCGQGSSTYRANDSRLSGRSMENLRAIDVMSKWLNARMR